MKGWFYNCIVSLSDRRSLCVLGERQKGRSNEHAQCYIEAKHSLLKPFGASRNNKLAVTCNGSNKFQIFLIAVFSLLIKPSCFCLIISHLALQMFQ
jgi:hypothetical protein